MAFHFGVFWEKENNFPLAHQKKADNRDASCLLACWLCELRKSERKEIYFSTLEKVLIILTLLLLSTLSSSSSSSSPLVLLLLSCACCFIDKMLMMNKKKEYMSWLLYFLPPLYFTLAAFDNKFTISL